MRAALCALCLAAPAVAEPVVARRVAAVCDGALRQGVLLVGEAVPLAGAQAARGVTVRRGLDVTSESVGPAVAGVAETLELGFEFTYCVDLAEPQTAYDLRGSFRLADAATGFEAAGELAEATTDAAPSAIYSATLDEKVLVLFLPGKAAWNDDFKAAYPDLPGGALSFAFEVVRDE